MTAAIPAWSGREALPAGACLLLEASAGTGKTWQIAHLVARLVAEEGLRIDRLLLITFTKAATAELRDRVRQRLAQLQLALQDQLPAEALDPLLAELLTRPQRPLLLSRVTAALTGFDQAPISTIHGFCQRMLTQLAFESGQSPGLEVLADASAVLQELVDDELACLFASADEVDVGVAAALGWTREGLRALAGPMAAAVAPQLIPASAAATDQPPAAVVLQVTAQWRQRADALRQWLDDPLQGGAALQAVQDELARPAKSKARRGEAARRWKGTFGKTLLRKELPELRAAVDASVPATQLQALEAWDYSRAEAAWTDGAFGDFAGSEVFARATALVQELKELYPLARSAFASRARARLDAELERRGVLSYEAMLWRLAERIDQEGPQGPLARAVRERFDVALIDEFQDTDAAQWAVLSGAFAHADRRLLLIGDPKQAIYAFRGADVHVYLQAAQGHRSRPPQRATMTTNWRSDPALVRAMNHLWADGSRVFGAVPFDYIAVQARDQAMPWALQGPGPGGTPRSPLEIRWLDARAAGDEPGPLSNKGRATALVNRALLREVLGLLQPEVRLTSKGGPPDGRAVRPQDLAVLVRTNAQAQTIQRLLMAAGVPAVASSDEPVVRSAAAGWLLSWLDALAQPSRERAARAAAVTPLFGWTLAQLAQALQGDGQAQAPRDELAEPSAADTAWGRWLADVQEWANLWPRVGFVQVWEAAQARHQVLQRLLRSEQGERHATDLRHLIELCHAEERSHRSGPGGLAAWLRRQRAGQDGPNDALSQRLESDAQAVQIVTIHKSKGLEYPIVLAPFLWDSRRSESDKGAPLLHHGDRGQLALDVRAAGAAGREAILLALGEEQQQEEARLLYVALTRAAHHAVAWLVPAGETAKNPANNAWARLLLRERDAEGAWVSDNLPAGLAAKRGEPPPDPTPWLERLALLCATSQGGVGYSVEAPLAGPLPSPVLPAHPDAELRERRWTRTALHDGWGVTSYTDLTRGHSWDGDSHRREQRSADVAPLGSAEPLPWSQDPGASAEPLDDEAAEVAEIAAAALSAADAVAWWQALGAGSDVGTWVHAVMEHLDFASGQAKDRRSLALLAAELGQRHAVQRPGQHQALQALVPGWLATPLDGASGLPQGFALRQLAASDRLDELPFDLGIGDGDANLRPERLRATLLPALQAAGQEGADQGRANLGGAGEGAAWLAAVLADTEVFAPMRGILTGTIDLVLRCGGRYYIADYKTNRLKDRQGQALSAALYSRDELARAMAEHGYHLQALLYSLAVHRWLRQRLGKNYSYDRDFGGHLYLFLRGMDGGRLRGADGACTGVFAERWPLAVIEALDRALSPNAADPADRGGEA